MKHINIANFKRSSDFYDELHLWVTIKSFDLQAIRKRYLKSRKNKSGKAGSVERREVSTGGIAYVQIVKGQKEQFKVLTRTKEPRGIDADGKNRFALATEDVVFIREAEQEYTLHHPWFSYIHTVRFSPHHKNRILIASSGLDMILEMDYKTEEVTFEWLAWENGWQKAHDPKTDDIILLTRSEVQAQQWERKGIRHKLISDPDGQVLPTAMRAAFINSVDYDPEDPSFIYATFFHEGAVYKIHKENGASTLQLSDLKNPHGGSPVNGAFFATSTASGELVLKNKDGKVIHYDFSKLQGKPKGLEELEWLQNSVAIGPHQFLTIDSNRNQFIITDIRQELMDAIPYDDNWAVQDLIRHHASPELEKWVSKL